MWEEAFRSSDARISSICLSLLTIYIITRLSYSENQHTHTDLQPDWYKPPPNWNKPVCGSRALRGLVARAMIRRDVR